MQQIFENDILNLIQAARADQKLQVADAEQKLHSVLKLAACVLSLEMVTRFI